MQSYVNTKVENLFFHSILNSITVYVYNRIRIRIQLR